jgi:hypothetical protein
MSDTQANAGPAERTEVAVNTLGRSVLCQPMCM